MRNLMNRWLDRILIWPGSYLGISDDWLYLWEESNQNMIADRGHGERVIFCLRFFFKL